MSLWLPTRLLATQSDRRLVELIAAGHERAFEVLVQRYRRPLLRYSARIAGSESLAEDIVQHTLLQAWVALSRGAAVQEIRPWLYRVAHNTTINTLRRLRAEQSLSPEATVDMRASPGQDLEQRMAVRDTLADLAALPAMQRDAIVLSAIDGRPHDEVAETLGVSDGAVRGLLYRARVTLRDAAAALTPGPLIGWASGAANRATPTAARLAGMCAPAASTGTVLAQGVTVAATAVLTLGAVVVPLRGSHSGAAAVSPTSSQAAHPRSGARSTAAISVRLPASAGAGGASKTQGAPRLTGGAGTPTLGAGRRPAPSSPGTGAGSPTTGAPASVQIESARASSPTAAAKLTEAPAQGPTPSGPVTGEAPPPPTPTGGGPVEQETSSEKAQREAEAARELREHEAEKAREAHEREEEKAREAREREEEALRERREREEEAARELKEREAEKAREGGGH
jgi:RNA polymerase sigma factor (sigma-70 family)